MEEDRRHSVESSQTQMTGSQSAHHKRQLEEVQAKLSQFRGLQQQHESKLRAAWTERNGQLWQRVEGVIKLEEDKVKAQLDAERQKREEEERRRREADERMKQEELRLREDLLRKKKENEEMEQQQAKAEEQRRLQTEMEAQKTAQAQVQDDERKAIGLTTAAEDWKKGRELLKVCSSFQLQIELAKTDSGVTETEE